MAAERRPAGHADLPASGWLSREGLAGWCGQRPPASRLRPGPGRVRERGRRNRRGADIPLLLFLLAGLPGATLGAGAARVWSNGLTGETRKDPSRTFYRTATYRATGGAVPQERGARREQGPRQAGPGRRAGRGVQRPRVPPAPIGSALAARSRPIARRATSESRRS